LAATKEEEPQKAQNTQDYGASRRISVPLAPFVVAPKFSQESKNWTDCSTDNTDMEWVTPWQTGSLPIRVISVIRG
jgi:hypothetical protein